jgi:hypothetical protein
MSLLACQATVNDTSVDVDSTVATTVAEALAIQPSPAAPDPSASVEAVVEATIEVTDLESFTPTCLTSTLDWPLREYRFAN